MREYIGERGRKKKKKKKMQIMHMKKLMIQTHENLRQRLADEKKLDDKGR